MKVYLYNVGRNLNRAYRTCFSFGIEELILIGKSADPSIAWELKGNLFSAKDKVKINKADFLPSENGILAMETFYKLPIFNFAEWNKVEGILIGGETIGIPKNYNSQFKATIPTINNYCLTVESALAITLYEWKRYYV